MEYILVRFDPNDPRDVLANGDTIGCTGVKLAVPADYYVITLSGGGTLPAQWQDQVAGTTPDHPLHIDFVHV